MFPGQVDAPSKFIHVNIYFGKTLGGKNSMAHQKNQSILVIDDNCQITNFLTEKLESLGYKVISATDGSTGLKHVQQHNPDLILLDTILPGINGFELLGRVREFSTVPIIMLSVNDADRHESMKRGASMFFKKPFNFDALLACVRFYI